RREYSVAIRGYYSITWQPALQNSQPIATHDAANILIAKARVCQRARELLQIRSGINFLRRRFHPEPPVKIRTDPTVPHIACKVANMLHVLYHRCKRYRFLVRAVLPP